MLMGSEFQICGAKILKPRDPNDKLCIMGTVICWYSDGFVLQRSGFDSHPGSIASSTEQVANILCAQVDSASGSQWDWK